MSRQVHKMVTANLWNQRQRVIRFTEINFKDHIAVIDVRERIRKGEHPRTEILRFAKEADKGTVLEIHLPHRAEPLVAGFESIGMNAIINELEPGHFRLMAVKL